ncbi:MAG: C-GCAxxG-C-C family protein [Candidatus Methanofastidiosia archaeon]
MIEMTPPTRENVLHSAYHRAYSYEKLYLVGPQCVLHAMEDIFGIGDDATFKSATGFVGGGGLMGDGTCGALAGGILVISGVLGRDKKGFRKRERTVKAYNAVRILQKKFKEEFGITCKEVQKKIFGRSFNLLDKKEYEEFEALGGHTDKCPHVVGKAAMWTADILLDMGLVPRKI